MKQRQQKQEKWEYPNCPSGELADVFKLAESFRAIEHAPAVRVDHFLLALVLNQYEPIADDVVKVFEKVRSDWRSSLGKPI
jgi:hypothetical protein